MKFLALSGTARVRCSKEIVGNSRLHHGYRALRTWELQEKAR